MKTKTENLRELDAWIAEHVFGYRWGHYGYVGKDGLPELGGQEPIYLCDPNKPGFGNAIQRNLVDEWPTFGKQSFPHYTTDPSYAMLVLEKCVTEVTVTIRKQSDGRFCIWWTNSDNMQENYIFGDTLPLSICIFAKKLFSK